MGTIAYLSAEIGLESSLPTYSGGLGVLAGDHVKAAADAGLDLIAISLLYRQGYGRQHVDSQGIQSETYPEFDPAEFLDDTGIEITLPLEGRTLFSRIWKRKVTGVTGSSVDVLFLDTLHPNNSNEHIALGERLYGGDDSTRIRQEFLLGVGGIRALKALGVWPLKGVHLNEGHCAFAALELLRQGWSRKQLKAQSLFTTHTPVPAGHDRFSWQEMENVLGELLPGDAHELAGEESASMSHLAISLCGKANAVSNLNAKVASKMFAGYHIEPITNGAHHITWISPIMAELYDSEISGWRKDPLLLSHAGRLQNETLAKARSKARRVLFDIVRSTTGVELEEDRLTIGFARRFATYKRADLVFRDLERLRSFGAGKIQFVFSGKAHPRDEGGKELIRKIFEAAKQLEDDIPVVFIEDYSMATGAAMTSGVDVWMNNPVRPMEASGTSGMKAVMNGVPNCSIMDGWWPEACEHGINGWAVGGSDDERNDERDNRNLLDSIEHEILPLWQEGGLRWAAISRAAIKTGARFTAARMIEDYQRIYENFTPVAVHHDQE